MCRIFVFHLHGLCAFSNLDGSRAVRGVLWVGRFELLRHGFMRRGVRNASLGGCHVQGVLNYYFVG